MTSTVEFELLGFPSDITSPDYQPKSPPTFNHLPAYPRNVLEDDTSEVIDLSFLEIEVRPKRRKRRSNKQKAEEQFDANAKPISLRSFIDHTIDEPQNLEIDIISDEKIDSENKLIIEDKELAEQCAIASLIIAQNNAPDEELDKSLIVDVDFPEEIVTEYYNSIGKDINDYDHTEDIVEYDHLKPNRKLFYERRLIQSVQLRSISSPEFIKSHFPVDEKLLSLDIKSLYNDDYNSWCIIKSELQNICENSESLNSLFYGEDWKQRFADLLNWKRCINLQTVAICTYWLFFSDKPLTDRNLKLIDFDNKLFGKTRFKYFTISELFSGIGINFITDYCAFPFYRDRIMNLFEHTHDDIIKNLKIEKRRIRKKKKFSISLTDQLSSFE